MKSIVISLVLQILLIACKSSSQNDSLPSCIAEKIETIKNEPARNPPAEVWKWQDDKLIYYYITSDCCDQYNYLYNEKCEVECAPDGGFTGKGNQKCPEFSDDLKKNLIWKDQRKVK